MAQGPSMNSFLVAPFRTIFGIGEKDNDHQVSAVKRDSLSGERKAREQDTIDLVSDSEHEHDSHKAKRSRLHSSATPSSHTFSPFAQGSHIENAYPNPLLGRVAFDSHGNRGDTMSMDKNDELRLLGDFRTIKDATPILAPGFPQPSVVITTNSLPQGTAPTKKPGADRGFRPKNTLHSESRFANRKDGPTRAIPRHKEITYSRREPKTLNLQASRGSNVTSSSHHANGEGQPNKRQKFDFGVQPRRTQYSEVIELDTSDEDTHQIVRRGPQSSPSIQVMASQSRPRRQSWEVSGRQEFRLVEDTLTRDKSKRNNTTTSYTAENGRQEIVPRSSETVEINSSIASAEAFEQWKQGVAQEVSGREPSLEILGKRGVIQSRIEHPSQPNKPSDNLSSYFIERGSSGGTARKKDDPSTVKAKNKRSTFLDMMNESDDEIAATEVASHQPRLADHESARYPDARSTSSSRDTLFNESGKQGSRRGKFDTTKVATATDSDKDELDSADIAPTYSTKARTLGKPNGTVHIPQDGIKNEFKIDEIVGPSRGVFNAPEPMILDFDAESAMHLKFKSRESGSQVKKWILQATNIVKVTYSNESQCTYMRIFPAGSDRYDLRFHEHQDLRDFLIKLRNVTNFQSDIRPSTYMDRIYGQHHLQQPVDESVELDLLQERLKSKNAPSTEIRSAIRRPRQPTLLSALTRTTNLDDQDGSIEDPRSENGIDFQVSSDTIRSNPMRSARSRRLLKEPTPPPERFSHIIGLGDPWEQPIVYPELGRRRVTVDFSDLERLDEGEFLNDSLIEFYIRWLQEKFPQSDSKVAFLSTHFYSKLSETRKSINYSAVEKWTKEDIFTRDFVIVPINENAHWYIAIICNLPSIQRKFREGDGSSSNPVDLSDSFGMEDKKELEPLLVGAQPSDAEKSRQQMRGSDKSDSITEEMADSQFDNSGIFSYTSQTTPVKNTRRRKSGPAPRKYPADLPAIAILDSLGNSHAQTLSNLKSYVIAEALSKRSMDIPKEILQGMNAKNIPMQNNFSDCGVFVCGYIHHFMSNPQEFGRKLLAKEFDLDSDWPQMDPALMRSNMRETLQAIAAEQKESRLQKKADRKRLKREAKCDRAELAKVVTSPLKPAVQTVHTNLSSPMKKLHTEKSSRRKQNEDSDEILFGHENGISPEPVVRVPSPQKEKPEEIVTETPSWPSVLEVAANDEQFIHVESHEQQNESQPSQRYEIPDSQPCEDERNNASGSEMNNDSSQLSQTKSPNSKNDGGKNQNWHF